MSRYDSGVQRVTVYDPLTGDLPYNEGVQRVEVQTIPMMEKPLSFLRGGDIKPTYSETTGLLTFPAGEADWILYVGGEYYTNFIDNNLASPFVLDFKQAQVDLGTTAVVLLYDPAGDYFTFRAWSQIPAFKDTKVIIATMRMNSGKYNLWCPFDVQYI